MISRGTPEQAAAASATVLTALHLPVDAFLRLLELRGTVGAGNGLRLEEWAEARSILALAHRRSRFEAWRTEERNASVRLDAAAFVTTARPVVEGTLASRALGYRPGSTRRSASAGRPRPGGGRRPAAFDRRRRSPRPVGKARGRARRQRLGRRPPPGSAAGSSNSSPRSAPLLTGRPGSPTRAAELDGPDPAIVAAAVTAVRDKLGGMGVAAFRRLAAVNATFADGLVPTEEAWADAERSLAAARKVKVLYPAWRAEESLPGRTLPYWRVLRQALTRWLAPAEDRYAWLAGLAARCRPTVVDPDLVPLTSIRTGAVPGLACAAEQRRNERLSQLYQLEQALRGTLTAPAGASDLERVDAALLSGLWTRAERDAVRADLSARRQARAAGDLAAGRQDSSRLEVARQVFGPDADRLAVLRADLDAGDPRAAVARRIVLGELGFSTETAFRDLIDLLAAASPVTATELSAFDQTLAAVSLLSRMTRAERIADLLGLRIETCSPRCGSTWRHGAASSLFAHSPSPVARSSTSRPTT